MSWPDRAWLAVAIALGGLAVYFAYVNVDFWVWVANSAFRGIRAPVDTGLGVQSVIFALLPVVAAVVAFVPSRRRFDSYHRPIICAASASLAASMIGITYSILLTLPF